VGTRFSPEDAFAEDQVVLIDGDRIHDVVARGDVPAGVPVEDWGNVALVPGCVNTHGHAFQNLLKGFADDRTFEDWRDAVLYPFSERLDRGAIRVGASFAFAEALLAGATTTVDFFYLHDAGNDNAEAVIQAARDIGIRLVLARALYDPDAPTKAPARYREPAHEAIERCAALADKHQADPFIEVQPAPHSLHAASPETIAAGLELARERSSRCHLHLAEASYERDQVVERYGTTPVRLLAREGLLDPRLVAIHAVWLDDEEIDLLAESEVKVVHCPGANAFLGDGIALIPEMLRRGVHVSLGPDGGCANNRQSIYDEMRMASLMAKARLTDGSAMSARSAFAMGTVGGSGTLGLAVGSLERGAFADVVALGLDDLSLQPVGMLERNIVNSMQPTAIRRVMVGGELVANDGHLVKVDESELVALVNEVTGGWARP
jgi:5-methylthioadenosine/S-adenosylhomocysteine deaminase